MANLTEAATWSSGIYQIETSDPVLGGANGIANRQAKELAARTQWLRTELNKAISSIGTNKTSTDNAIALKADKSRQITAGAGLTGGGDLSANRTIGLATPSTLSGSTTNWLGNGATGHTHEIAKATPTLAGVVKLINALNSTATDAALTAAQGKILAEQIGLAVSGGMALRGSLAERNLNDLYDVDNYGVWQNSSNAAATAERNYPTTKAGTLFVLPSAYKGQQIYIPFDHKGIYIRDTRTNNTPTTWGAWFKIGEDKLGNSGNQTLDGILTVGRANDWQNLRLPSGNGTWILETHPNASYATENSIRFNFKFEETGQATKYVSFPAITENEAVAYRSFVRNLVDGKVAKSGDTMTGHLVIGAGSYSSVRLINDGERETRLETVPASNTDVVFQLADRQGNTGGFTGYRFPKATSTQYIAYQSFVNEQLAEKADLKTVDIWSNPNADYTKSGFYRANGKQINDLPLPSLEMHITHPNGSNNAYARGIGFNYGGNFGVYTTSWDKNGNYLGQKTILTEENGVMLSGTQTIAGEKIFSTTMRALNGIHFSGSSRENVFGTLGMGQRDIYLRNITSNKYLQLKDDGTLAYSDDKVLLFSHRSNAVNLDDADKVATSKAVKIAYDKAVEVQNATRNAAIMGNTVNQGNLSVSGSLNAGGVVSTSYRSDGVGFIAKQPTEGKHGFYDVAVNNISRGGLQIGTEGEGRYFVRLLITPAGATNADRRVNGLSVYDNAIYSNAYGWFHNGFVRAGVGIGQNPDHQVKIGWSSELRLKATVDNVNLGNFVFDEQLSRELPSGMIAYFAGAHVPTGWLKCNGAAVSRTTYAGIFAQIGTHYGAGNGSTTFNLPDLRGEFIRAWDDGRGLDRNRQLGSIQNQELLEHYHHIANFGSAGRGIAGSDLTGETYMASHAIDGATERYGLRKSVNNAAPNVGKTSNSGAGENRPRNIALTACIKI